MTQTSAPWAYSTPRDNTAITLAALASTTAFTIGAAAIFSPWALAVAAGYTGYKLAPVIARTFSPTLRTRYLNKLERGAHFTRAPANHPATLMAQELSAKMGIATPPLLIADATAIKKMALPFGLRWMMNSHKTRQSIMESAFAADPGTRFLLATRESLAKFDGSPLRFIMAHEMAHIRKEKASPVRLARMAIKFAGSALVVATATTATLGLFGLGVSALAGFSALGGLGALAVTYAGATALANAGIRTFERRADRNALYLTGDLDAATEAFAMLHNTPTHQAKRTSALSEIFTTHPGQVRRVESLRTAFALVASRSDFAPPAQRVVTRPSNDNAHDDVWSLPQEKPRKIEWDTPDTIRRNVR